jgi:hypothetical protein
MLEYEVKTLRLPNPCPGRNDEQMLVTPEQLDLAL